MNSHSDECQIYLIKQSTKYEFVDGELVEFYKIGCGNSKKRLATLQTGNPTKLELAHSIDVPKRFMKEGELELQWKFRHYSAQNLLENGNPSKKQEWFGFTKKLLHRCLYYMNRMEREIKNGGCNYYREREEKRSHRSMSLRTKIPYKRMT